MDDLYSYLRREIAAFHKHVEECQHSFDMDSLGLVLRDLSAKHKGEIDSLEQLQELVSDLCVESKESAGASVYCMGSNIKHCISWLLAFMQHLRAMKDTFDEHVVVPLCENLYVLEEHDDSTTDLVSLRQCSTREIQSVSKVADDLLRLRRRWALMLLPGPIREENISLQNVSACAQLGSRKFSKVKWLVPDILYKSSVAAQLANQWVDLHQRGNLWERRRMDGYGTAQMSPMRYVSMEPERMSSELSGSSLTRREDPVGQTLVNGEDPVEQTQDKGENPVEQTQAKLSQLKAELLASTWREEQLHALEARLAEVSDRIQHLQAQLGQERLKDGQGVQLEADRMGSSSGSPEGLPVPAMNVDQRLKMVKYQRKILLEDLLLKMQIQPALIRYTDMVRDLCRQCEESIQVFENSGSIRPSYMDPTNQLSLKNSPIRSSQNGRSS